MKIFKLTFKRQVGLNYWIIWHLNSWYIRDKSDDTKVGPEKREKGTVKSAKSATMSPVRNSRKV